MKRLLLVLALLGFAWWLDCSDAVQAGYVPSREQIIEDMNDKPVDSFPGQYAWDGMEWVDTSMEAQWTGN